MRRSAILPVVLWVAAVVPAWAQEQSQSRRWVPYPDTLSDLIIADVQAKLGLSDDQKRTVKTLESDWLKEWEKLNQARDGLSAKQFAEKQREAEKPFATKARKLLTEEQAAMLKEIRFEQQLDFYSPLSRLRAAEMQTELRLAAR